MRLRSDRLIGGRRRGALCVAGLVAVVLAGVGVRRWQRHAKDSATPFRPSREDLSSLGRKNQQSVAEAIRLGKPERVSSLVAARPFDVEAFEHNPEGYLAVVEPARCFQTAQPGAPDAVYLKAISDPILEVQPGKSAPLMVRGVPNMPVTFTAFGAGTFHENDLASVTVRADAHGFAMVHAVPPQPGRGDMRVQVGSPVAVGSQLFVVRAVDRNKVD